MAALGLHGQQGDARVGELLRVGVEQAVPQDEIGLGGDDLLGRGVRGVGDEAVRGRVLQIRGQ